MNTEQISQNIFTYIMFMKLAFHRKALRTSQGQAIIRLIEKRSR